MHSGPNGGAFGNGTLGSDAALGCGGCASFCGGNAALDNRVVLGAVVWLLAQWCGSC